MSQRNNPLANRSRKQWKAEEKRILARKIERGFTRTTENFAEAIALARKPVPMCVPLPEIRLPLVHHMGLGSCRRVSTLEAMMLHYKAETGAVLVLHKHPRSERIVIPSCLGVLGEVIDSCQYAT